MLARSTTQQKKKKKKEIEENRSLPVHAILLKSAFLNI